MIVALWHRWFDSREHRRAREVAERNYGRTLVTVAKLRTENEELRRAGARADGDAKAADRAEVWEERAHNAEKALADARQRVRDLERQLDELTLANVTAHRVVDQHAQVSALPPALTRDRQALSRLEDGLATAREIEEKLRVELREAGIELAASRVLIEKCRREHR